MIGICRTCGLEHEGPCSGLNGLLAENKRLQRKAEGYEQQLVAIATLLGRDASTASGQEIERLKARIGVLLGHLNWIGWSSEGVEKVKAEQAQLTAEVAEWKQRAVGGMCRVLSDFDCDCSLCRRDAKIIRLRATIYAVRDLAAQQRPTVVFQPMRLIVECCQAALADTGDMLAPDQRQCTMYRGRHRS